MNAVLKRRLQALDEAIEVLAQRAAEQRRINEKKAEIVQNVIGLPYYWGDYSGTLHASSKPTYVEARLIHQTTGEEVHWTLNAFHVYEHLKTIKEFSSWEEYNEARKLAFAVSTEEMLFRYGCSETEVKEKMTEYCTKFKIPYKSYFQEVA
jgi:hypothetical protein